MEFMKLSENGIDRCWAKVEGEEVELKVTYSHGKPEANIAEICEGRQKLAFGKITKEGEWVDVEIKPHEPHTQLKLTAEESARIAELEAEIAKIKATAKARKPVKFDEMNKEQQIEYLKAQLAKLEG